MALPRLQLFEVNDHPRAPAPLRDTIVESLSRTLRWGRMLDGLVPPLRRFLAEAGTTDVLDLCAGSGGPATILADAFLRDGGPAPRITLTDLFPHVEDWRAAVAAHPGALDFVADPVDATAIPAPIARGRVRTVINAFHHFPPSLAAAILRDAVASSRGIFVSEAFDRNPLRYISFFPVGIVSMGLNPLLTRRDRLAKALLTYATPAAALAGLWDGFVSTLRIYHEEEVRAMVAPFGGGWRWEFGTYEFKPFGRGRWFYGVPA